MLSLCCCLSAANRSRVKQVSDVNGATRDTVSFLFLFSYLMFTRAMCFCDWVLILAAYTCVCCIIFFPCAHKNNKKTPKFKRVRGMKTTCLTMQKRSETEHHMTSRGNETAGDERFIHQGIMILIHRNSSDWPDKPEGSMLITKDNPPKCSVGCLWKWDNSIFPPECNNSWLIQQNVWKVKLCISV